MIFHVTTILEWESQLDRDEFFPADYEREGFIHCSTEDQLPGVLERYFKDKSGLALIHIDELKLKPELRFEPSTNNEKFPHVYGGINHEAVVKVTSAVG
jgi:uncharacterized protein (DUF952 family)